MMSTGKEIVKLCPIIKINQSTTEVYDFHELDNLLVEDLFNHEKWKVVERSMEGIKFKKSNDLLIFKKFY